MKILHASYLAKLATYFVIIPLLYCLLAPVSYSAGKAIFLHCASTISGCENKSFATTCFGTSRLQDESLRIQCNNYMATQKCNTTYQNTPCDYTKLNTQATVTCPADK